MDSDQQATQALYTKYKRIVKLWEKDFIAKFERRPSKVICIYKFKYNRYNFINDSAFFLLIYVSLIAALLLCMIV